MKVLFVASEVMPWSKTGGLADVAGALPPALAARGHEITVVSPLYKDLDPAAPTPTSTGIFVPVEVAGDRLILELFEAHGAGEGGGPLGRPTGGGRRAGASKVRWLFLGNPSLYGRAGLYGTGGRDHPDNALRFAALSFGALEAMRALGLTSDIVHANDWQTGPLAMRATLLRDGRPSPRTVFTIHNLAFQGLFPPETLDRLGWPRSLLNLHELEFYGQLSFLKAGLVFADALTTVSQTYAREICAPEHGAGLDGLLRSRRDRLHGILNGIDTFEWDPRRDRHLPAHYQAEDLSGKARCKAALQKEFGLPVDPTRPLFTSISRFTPQKGFDLLVPSLDEAFLGRAQVAMLGSGDAAIQRALEALQRAHPTSFAVRVGFDEALAHRMEAGGDFFLMPSRFEPCGLNQLYSLRYGTIPIVRATGGLVDTVEDAPADLATGTGFVFEEPTSAALRATLDRALAAEGRPEALLALRRRGMAKDFSWEVSSAQYERLYQSLLE